MIAKLFNSRQVHKRQNSHLKHSHPDTMRVQTTTFDCLICGLEDFTRLTRQGSTLEPTSWLGPPCQDCLVHVCFIYWHHELCMKRRGNTWLVYSSKWGTTEWFIDSRSLCGTNERNYWACCRLCCGRHHYWEEDLHRYNYADDVSILVKMAEVLLLSLGVMSREGKPFGLEIIWEKPRAKPHRNIHMTKNCQWLQTMS